LGSEVSHPNGLTIDHAQGRQSYAVVAASALCDVAAQGNPLERQPSLDEDRSAHPGSAATAVGAAAMRQATRKRQVT
jgi:hypothetical protein